MLNPGETFQMVVPFCDSAPFQGPSSMVATLPVCASRKGRARSPRTAGATAMNRRKERASGLKPAT